MIRYETFLQRYTPLNRVPQDLLKLFRDSIPKNRTEFASCFWDTFVVESYIRFRLEPLILLSIAKDCQKLFEDVNEFVADHPDLCLVTLIDEKYLRLPCSTCDCIDLQTKELIPITDIPSPTIAHSINITNIINHFCSNKK